MNKNFLKKLVIVILLLLTIGVVYTKVANALSVLTVQQGGTGVGTITGIIKGNGTSPFSAIVSGTDIKTINGTSVLGSGDIVTPQGTVTSVSGTSNRITSTGGATPVIDISGSYVGQSSITTLGTIGTGVWNGTAIANANLANSTISGVALGSSLNALTATNGSLTFSGNYDGSTARTVGLNVGNANTWTGQQTFNTSAPIFGTITGVAAQCLHVDTNGLVTGTGSDCGSGSGGATTALDNLASVAINTSLISDTDNTDDLGSATKEWKDIYIDGTAYLDAIDLNGTGITSTATQLNYLSSATGTTGTTSTNLVFSGSPTLTTASLGSSTATTQTPGDNSTKLATTAYVQAAIFDTTTIAAAKYGTTANLTATYSNGSSGVGATLTEVGLGALSIDGSTPSINDRILVKNQTNTFENGVYTVTVVGDVGTAYILTRSTDYNVSADIELGDTIFVSAGSALASTTWTQNGTDSPVVGTDAITFAQTAGLGTYTAGNGLTLTGSSFAINTAITADLSTAQTFTNKTLTSPKINENVALTTTATKLNYLTSATGTTGTTSTNIVFSTSPSLTTPSLGEATYTTLNGGNITDSALTATRVTFAGASGILSDDAGFTFTAASDQLQLGSAGTDGSLKIFSEDGGTDHSTIFNPAIQTQDITYTLPSDDGDAGEQLQTNGTGTLTWEAAGGGAPADADYLVGTANGSLSAEIVVGTSPGGELGGTWASPTIDDGVAVANWVLTTPTITTSLLPTSNDGAPLGDTTHQFSDLFLAEGGVINWDNGDATLTQAGDVLTLTGADLKITTAGNAATSVLTTDATQTLTNKTLTSSTNVLGGVTMTLGSDADGDMYYRASNVLTRLAKGTSGQVLTMNSGATAPSWSYPNAITMSYGNFSGGGILTGYSDVPAIATLAATGADILIEGQIPQTALATAMISGGDTIDSFVNIGSFTYFLVTETSTTPDTKAVYRMSNNAITTTNAGTVMTYSGTALANTNDAMKMTSDGTNIYFNFSAGNSASSFIIAKYSLSGTVLTSVSTTTLGSATISDFAVKVSGVYYAHALADNNDMFKFDSAGTLTNTYDEVLASGARMIDIKDTIYLGTGTTGIISKTAY